MNTTRDRILDATNRLFIARGASNVSMEGVATEAGVGRATIYRHFEDWIRQYPEQWICLKRRWPKSHKL